MVFVTFFSASIVRPGHFINLFPNKTLFYVQKLLWPLTFHLKEFQCIILDNLSRLLHEQWIRRNENFINFRVDEEAERWRKISFLLVQSHWINKWFLHFINNIKKYFQWNGKRRWIAGSFNKDLYARWTFLKRFPWIQVGIVGELRKVLHHLLQRTRCKDDWTIRRQSNIPKPKPFAWIS